MNIIKIRSEVIFGLSVAFALKAGFTADWISAALAGVFFAAHQVERYFSLNSVEAEVKKKITELEDALKITITELGYVKLGANIRTTPMAAAMNATNNLFNQGK